MRTVEYNGYVITEKGQVYGLNGTLRKPLLKNGRYEMRFTTPTGPKTYPLARIVYAVFHDEFDITDVNQCITFKDNDKMNVSLDNLVCAYRGDLIQGDGHRNRIALTSEMAEQIRKDYKETRGNRPVNQYDSVKPYNSYRTLAKKYKVTFALIKQIIEGNTRNKAKYKL